VRTRPDLAALALCAVAVAGIVVLTLLGKAVPDVLTLIASTALGVGGGAALPLGSSSSRSSAAAPAPADVDPGIRTTLPAPLTAEPETGVFRVARHL